MLVSAKETVQAARAGHYAIGGEEDGVIGMGECADPANKGFDPRKLLAPGTDGVVDMVKYKIEVFGSKDKA